MRRAAVALGALVALGSATPAAQAAPARYDGQSRGGHPVVLRLTEGRATYDVRVGGRCSDGSRFRSGLRGEDARIDSAGRFFVDAPAVRGSYRGRRGSFAFRLRARRDRPEVRGTVRVSFRGGGLRCDSGRAAFAAFRDGTRRAPFRDARARTGRYTARGRGLRDVRVDVFLPARRIRSIAFRWRVGCRGGRQLTGPERFTDLRLGAGRFALSGRSTVRLRAGRISREAWSLRGRLLRRDGAYRVEGTWRVRAVVTRGGRQLTRCATRGLKFSGRYRG